MSALLVKMKMSIKKINSKNHPAFTLIEVIVAMGIFVVLVTMVLANFRASQKEDDLRQSALELADNLRKVQNLGMSGQITKFCQAGDFENKACQSNDDCNGAECAYSVPLGGYGLYVAPVNTGPLSGYTLFVDLDGDLCFECKDEIDWEDAVLPAGEYSLIGKTVISSYDLQCNFGDVPWQEGCVDPEPNGMDVVFMPPKPTPWAGSHNIDIQEEQKLLFLLKQPEIEKCLEVIVNGVSGDVSVNNPELGCKPYN